jgi:diguanylate cyclase (GGDEF)-like protein
MPALGTPIETPRLPRGRGLVFTGGLTLFAVLLAIGASLFALRHDRDIQHNYQQTLTLTNLAFDAESLASRMRSLEEMEAQQAGTSTEVLRSAVRAVDIDAAEWGRRTKDAVGKDVPSDAQVIWGQLQRAIETMRADLHTAPSTPDASPAAGAEPAPAGEGQTAGPATTADAQDASRPSKEELDRRYLAAVEAAQAALLASFRSGGERTTIAGYTAGEIASAVVAGSTLVALVLGGVLAAMVHHTQHESRATIGVMGELLRTDPLTGITNRRGLDENLPVEIGRAKRTGSTLSVAMIDLDYFKRYNSRRGHAGGDSLLRIAAQAWRKQLRPTDTLVRYGGEEFTLVLPSCDADQACQLIARLRPLLPDNQTFSAGVATWDFRESGEELLRRADEALLLAKKHGRNRTIVSGREEQIPLPLTAS